MNMPKEYSRTVWSSEAGDRRKEDSKAAIQKPLPPGEQMVYLHRDSKGRGGKGVTILRGLVLTEADLAVLVKTLKKSLGVGGTVKGDVVELQTQEREKIAQALRKKGYKIKIAGG
jgi:translation initiation factor 1